MLRLAVIFAAAAFAAAVPSFAAAHGAGDMDIEPQPRLLAAVVELGGGPGFQAATFRKRLAAVRPGEERALARGVGNASIGRFDRAFTLVVQATMSEMFRSGQVPAVPLTRDPKALAGALYRAGTHHGRFDVEMLFDALFSHEQHDAAMAEIGKTYGAASDTAYHVVMQRLVTDVGRDLARPDHALGHR